MTVRMYLRTNGRANSLYGDGRLSFCRARRREARTVRTTTR